jgi:hypothetical protein
VRLNAGAGALGRIQTEMLALRLDGDADLLLVGRNLAAARR